ncbi:MAG: hypothetical protein RL368_2211 [Pseudomonadota bacterium]|jgi:hypothetical protein
MKLSYKFVQALGFSLVLLGNNAVFGKEVFEKSAQTTVKKPNDHSKHSDEHKHRRMEHYKKVDDKPTFSLKMKNDKKK